MTTFLSFLALVIFLSRSVCLEFCPFFKITAKNIFGFYDFPGSFPVLLLAFAPILGSPSQQELGAAGPAGVASLPLQATQIAPSGTLGNAMGLLGAHSRPHKLLGSSQVLGSELRLEPMGSAPKAPTLGPQPTRSFSQDQQFAAPK